MPKARSPSSALFTLAAIIVAIAALHFAKEILLPLALAILLGFLLTPPADRLERWGLGRVVSVLAVVGVTFVLLGVLGWMVTSQMVDLSAQLPQYKSQIVRKIREIRPQSETFDKVAETIEDVQKELADEEEQDSRDRSDADKDATEKGRGVLGGDDSLVGSEAAPGAWDQWWRSLTGRDDLDADGSRRPVDVRVVGTPPSPLMQVREWLGPLVAPLSTAGIAVVLLIFMLIKREEQRNRLMQLFGGAHLHATTEALTDVTERVSRYLRMQFLINAGYGLLVGTGLTLMGLPNGVMWGVLSFSLRFLPYVGPWLSAIMPLTVSVAISDGWTQPLMVVCWFGVLELLVNTVAEPLLYGRSTGVSGVGVIVAAVFWTWIWGPIGLVLAMPLTVCLVVMAHYIPALRFLTVLLGDQTSMPIEERIYQRLLAGDGDEARTVALEQLAATSLVEVYDEALIPALRLAERDRHAGVLSDEQEEAVQATARDLVEDLGEAAPEKMEVEAPSSDAADDQNSAPISVLCIPLRDEADETSAIMLQQLLAREGIEVEVAADEALTGEVVDRVESLKSDVVVISILPPLPARTSRLLCRRLRDRYPQLPVLVGYWNAAGMNELPRRLAQPGDAETFTTLADTVNRIRAIAARLPAMDQADGSTSGRSGALKTG